MRKEKDKRGSEVIITDDCMACGQCVEVCPFKAIDYDPNDKSSGYKSPVIDQAKCLGCGLCKSVCPGDAIE
jgi:heterodisulfide reductase subunit A